MNQCSILPSRKIRHLQRPCFSLEVQVLSSNHFMDHNRHARIFTCILRRMTLLPVRDPWQPMEQPLTKMLLRKIRLPHKWVIPQISTWEGIARTGQSLAWEGICRSQELFKEIGALVEVLHLICLSIIIHRSLKNWQKQGRISAQQLDLVIPKL